MAESQLALVTGGARRVGRAIVQKLAQNGFDVAFTYHASIDDAASLQSQIQSLGRKCIPIVADLTHPTEAAQTIAATLKPFSHLNVLVNNASIYRPGKLQDSLSPDASRMWTIHVEAPLELCRTLEAPLRAGHGRVINMVDVLAERPWPNYLAYSASKAALWNLTLGLARALAPDVTVNGIAPGVVEWPAGYPQTDKDKYLKRVPLDRAGTPNDVAEAVVFFATTGSYVTGQIMRLDGGRSIT